MLKSFVRERDNPFELPIDIRKGVYELRDSMFLASVEGKEILELGCGYGYNAFFFSTKAKAVTGVDINRRAITEASKRFHDIENLYFILDDALAFLEVTDKTYDAIVLFEFIEHLPEIRQRALIGSLWAKLKPNGMLFLSTPNGKHLPFYRKNPFHIHEFDTKGVMQLLSSHFNVIEVKGQIPLFLYLCPIPWAIVEWFCSSLHIYERIYGLRGNVENSRTIILLCTRKE